MFKKFIRKFFSEKGQALIETVLIITLVSLTAVGALSATGVSVNDIYTNIAAKFDGGGTEPVEPEDIYDLANAIIAEIEAQAYTGDPIEPELTVANCEGTPLTLDTDYTVAYENNTDVGEATATVSGTGDYHGSKTISFDIVPTVIDTVPSQDGTLTYNGNTQTPSWKDYDSAKLEISGVTEGKDAAEYTACFTPKAGYSWADGSRDTKNVKWTIGKLNLGNATVTCSGISSWEGGTKQSTPTVTINGTTVPSNLYTVSYSTPDPSTSGSYKSTCSATVTAANANVTGSKTANYTVTRKSYTISYNANSGSGAPSSQTKYYDVSLTLSSTKPTRSGYEFQGWATSSTATTASYAAGASYTSNAGTTLYAVWKQSLPSGTKLYKDYAMTQETTNFSEAVVATCTSTKIWGAMGTNQSGIPDPSQATYDSQTGGLNNTNWVLTNTSLGTTSGTIWQFCKDIRTASGNNSWYVPAIGELRSKYSSTMPAIGSYWSSSETYDDGTRNSESFYPARTASGFMYDYPDPWGLNPPMASTFIASKDTAKNVILFR